ncbi:MAG: amino acid adenylation domain-containing protein, partial [Proteobacteria bacterium]|nr:amino acid adenylation domain-containing protein [Pseudomonadota bacterium]
MDAKNDLPKNRNPLSYSQQSLWFIYKLSPDSGCYNINYTWEITTGINLSALKEAIRLVTDRHPQLRNLIQDKEGVPFQEERKGAGIFFEVIDGKSWNDDKLDRFIKQETLKPFNFQEDCHFRWIVIRLSGGKKLLSVTGPHISSDLWSHIRFMNDVRFAHNEITEGQNPTFPELEENYTDFIKQQQEYVNSTAGEQAFRFWKKILKRSTPILDLPTDYMRSANPHFGFTSLKLILTSSQSEKLKKLAYSNSSTPYALLLAVYYVLLYRLTHQEDISIGTPVPGRNKRDFKDVVGYFVNTVVVRQKVDGEEHFLTFLKHLTDSIKAIREHQDYPFALLAEKLRPARNSSNHPFFNVMFSLEDPNSFLEQEKDLVTISEEGETWEMGKFSMKLVQKAIVDDFDLSLRVRVIKNNYSTVWAYNSKLFNPETINRFAEHFNTLLNNILVAPDLPIDRIPILNESEYKTITVDWNNTATKYPNRDSVVSIFESCVRDFPEKVALEFKGTQLLYRELNSRSNQLAHFLISKKVSSEEPVIVCMDRSFEMIIAIIAIVKTGGVYVPIDPEYPEERKQYMLKDSGSKIVLTQGVYAANFRGSDLIVSSVDKGLEEFSKYSDQNLNLKIDADQLLYVLYTSGSTGEPKGVCVSHRNAIRLVKNTNYMHFGPEEKLLMFAPLTFDLSTFEIWGALLNGGSLSIFDPHMPALGELAQFIFDRQITTLWLTSGLYHQVAENHLQKLINVKQLIVGGDVVSVSHALKTIETLKNTQLINGYGPTENATFTCCYRIDDPAQIQYTVPIGKPIANTKVYIVDKNLSPVPIGVTGELCTSGDGLARGYLNKPEKTLEKFVNNPFSKNAADKLYKTGDLARYRPDGNIEFLGRTDFQVKIRGFRIEPGEI